MDLSTGAFSPAEDRTCLSQPVPDNPGLVATDLGTRPHPNPAIRISSADEQIQLADLTDAVLFALRCDRAVPQHIDFETMVPSFRAASGGGEIKLSDQAKL